ncbi:PD-(D/E)XK nuclease-like domain-containing protein [Larkinella arboricola]
MTEHDYRTTRAYSVSDLNELDRLLLGELPWAIYWRTRYLGIPYHITDPKILKFGSTLHQMALEPEKPLVDEWHTLEEWETLHRMLSRLEEPIRQYFTNYPCEVPLSGTCELTGLRLKGKADCDYFDSLIDLKTTSCRKYDSFVASFDKYNYWRQAAYYIHLTGRSQFIFIGIGKTSPYPIFEVTLDADHPKILSSMKQVHALLKRAKVEAHKSNGWFPSSWFKKENIVLY